MRLPLEDDHRRTTHPVLRHLPLVAGLCLCLLAHGCGDDGGTGTDGGGDGDGGGAGGDGDGDGSGTGGDNPKPDVGDGMVPGRGPGTNGYSWDGSWEPSSDSFPIAALYDETHGDLPPGKWGWDNDCDCPGDQGTAIYDNEFVNKGLDFERLEHEGNHFGWRLVDTDGGDTSLNHRGDKYEGTPGVDLFDLGAGQLQGTGPNDESPGINLGDGPDMLRYGTGWSVDMRVGDGLRGGEFDNDLVILGTEQVLPEATYDIEGTTVHTGPGADLVFVRNFGPAAVDLGNGESGRTDALDPLDGDDMIVLQGNMRDFRVFGGVGDDVAVWYVDDVKENTWLGPNFFGGGAWGDAVWGDPGVDRLVLVIDPATEIVTERGMHDGNPGSLLAMVYSDYGAKVDAPTEDDVFARYYGVVPEGPDGQHTITLSYRSADGGVFTHDFYITAIEELQLGVGDDAAVYEVDHVTGALTPSDASPLTEVPSRDAHATLFDEFGR